MGWLIWAGVLPLTLASAWLLLRRPARQLAEELQLKRARVRFRRRREWLEAEFLGALARTDPLEGLRWEDAQWHDEVVWARDRQTRRLLALVGVHFPDPFDLDAPADSLHHATALFEYRQGRWLAEGKYLDETHPAEVFLRLRRIEPIILPHRRAV